MSIQNDLLTSVQFIKGVGPERAKMLKRLGVSTVYDLLYFFPRKYLDRSQIKKIRDVSKGIDEEQTIQGTVMAISSHRGRTRKSILEVAIGDGTGVIMATWFNQPYLKQYFKKETRLMISGKVKLYNRRLQFASPEFELGKDSADKMLHTGGIIPCYSLTEGLSQKVIRSVIKRVLEKYVEVLPDVFNSLTTVLFGRSLKLMPIQEAINHMHFPVSVGVVEAARRRLVYEELFLFQLVLAGKRQEIKRSKVKYPLTISSLMDKRIRARIPFQLTRSQGKVIQEIKADLECHQPMNRLLQGDVGSGKTIVAVYAALAAIGNGTQVAFMAPTEILAEQHYQTLTRLLKDSRVRLTLLTSGLKARERQEKINQIKKQDIDLIVGTHALIQEDVGFSKLGLLIIDEQHKFGVLQRASLRGKGINPHLLVMTATPIPRTLALTAFGELDLSTINELPPGRRPVKTILRSTKKIAGAFSFIRDKIKEGRQVYFVYPLIEQSPRLEANKIVLKSATQMAKYLKKEVFKEFNIALLHGAMKEQKKDRIMKDFRQGKIQVLVSTVVIEVGIDVPNASVMVIDNAERYGLSQLHQLRGRVGRSSYQSYCLLFGDFTTPGAKKRLRVMEATNDGFKIAEEDLRIRGPGEFLGTRQSGLPEFKIADLTHDFSILQETRQAAFKLMRDDPQLKKYPGLNQMAKLRFKESALPSGESVGYSGLH
ncbi:ATP-dependent DNA helicase RecG [Planctomycetota bacterium]